MPAKNIKCLIIEDEKASQEVLIHFIKKTEGLQLINTFNRPSEAFELIENESEIDLLFLDINMSGETGIDFLKRLTNPPYIIFTTAYSEYAVEAFALEAVDYLMKPIAYERFLKAVDKVKPRNENKSLDHIMLNENKVIYKVPLESIQYLEGSGDYVKVFTDKKMIMTHSTLTKLHESLPNNFLRTHKSFVINTDLVQAIEGNMIKLEEATVPIGLTYKQQVMTALNWE